MRPVLALVLAALLLAGCGKDDDSPDPGETRELGRLVATWSQAEYADLGAAPRRASQLLSTDAERTAYLAGLPAGIDTAAARRIDLAESVIVAGAYPRCMEQGRVLADPLRFDVFVPAKDEGTVCVWAPMTVEVWEVPRADLDRVPEGLSEPGGRIAAVPVALYSEVEDRGLRLDGVPEGARLLRTDAERTAFLADLPDGLDLRPVRAADLDRHLLVTWLHPVCVEPEFVVDAEHTELTVRPGPDRCQDGARGRRQLDVWLIPRTELSEDVALRRY